MVSTRKVWLKAMTIVEARRIFVTELNRPGFVGGSNS
jgi:hypothetical protein